VVPPALQAKCLGRIQSGNGDDLPDIRARIKTATGTLASMKAVWDNPMLTAHYKRMLYHAHVVSAIVYPSEAWFLGPEAISLLIDFNDKWIEAAHIGPYNILAEVHQRRLRFLGHVFRAEQPTVDALQTLYTNQSLRAVLLGVKCSNKNSLRRRHYIQHLSHMPLIELNGGASPHVADFSIDIAATFRHGTIFELVPQFDSFASLWSHLAERGGDPQEQKTMWHTEITDIVQAWSASMGYAPISPA
jgi:hypothetical protein